MAEILPMPLLQLMENSWNGQWYSTDQYPLENVFEGLDVEALTQQYNIPHQSQSLPQSTFGAFQQQSHAAQIQAVTTSAIAHNVRAHNTNLPTGFASSHPPPAVFSPPPRSINEYHSQNYVERGDSRPNFIYNSVPSTPQAITSPQSASPVVPSQRFQPLEASYERPTTLRGNSLKRSQSDAEVESIEYLTKRRQSHDAVKRVGPILEEASFPGLSEDEKLLMELKEEKNMPWKEISKEFEHRLQRPYQVPALQMRWKRLKERLRQWTAEDVRRFLGQVAFAKHMGVPITSYQVAALEAAHEHWETSKYEIIAQKMLEFGIREKWPAKYVERKWQQMRIEGHEVANTTPSTLQPMPYRTLTRNLSIIGGVQEPGRASTSVSPDQSDADSTNMPRMAYNMPRAAGELSRRDNNLHLPQEELEEALRHGCQHRS